MTFERRLYGHRGASAEYPENTLEAFARALEVGATDLESDVHMTSDGHLVLAHDPDGERMASVREDIAASTLEAVQSWDVGVGFRDKDGMPCHEGKGMQIPTFAEALDRFPGVRFNVDVKVHSRRMAEAVARFVMDRGDAERVTLSSFSSRALKQVRALGYPGETALGRNDLVSLWFAPRALYGTLFGAETPRAVQVPMRAGSFRFDRLSFIDKCHDLGMRVDFWTINDPRDAERLLDSGADGIMTDDPALIAPLFA
jgi:glycerophosphoryl diester phosphodiesterase